MFHPRIEVGLSSCESNRYAGSTPYGISNKRSIKDYVGWLLRENWRGEGKQPTIFVSISISISIYIYYVCIFINISCLLN